ncbi:MAG: outer membrane beta-barrel protein [Bacteroidia bacterium]
MRNYFRLFMLAFAFSLSANTLFAQGGYVNFNVGYGLKMGSQNLEYFGFYNYSNTGNSTTSEQVFVSLGKGLNVGASFGYMFNKNIGAELGVSYLLGGKSTVKDSYPNGSRAEYTLSSNMLRIFPSLVIATGFEKINPYAKFGVVIGSGSVKYEIVDYDGGDVTKMKMKLNGGIAFGLSSGIGALFNLSEKMAFYGELNMVNLSYAPKKGEVTKFTFNGVNYTGDMTTREREVEFVDRYTYNPSNPPSDSQPSQELKQKLPYGSIGLNIGLRINF